MSSQDPIPISAAQIIGGYCETLTFGIYLATCWFCARTLLFTSGPEERLRKPNEIQWLMLSIAAILFTVSVFDDIIGFIHNLAAFVWYSGNKEKLADFQGWINLSRTVNQVVNMMLGDLLLIYRCYFVLGQHLWIILVPVVLYLVGAAMAVKLVIMEGTTNNSAITLLSSGTTPWWLVFLSIMAVQSLLTTSLLVWRIWRVELQNVKYRENEVHLHTPQPSLRKVIRVIAESGAVYTMLIILTFAVTLCKSNALYPISNATLQATGITFNIIVVRSSLHRDQQFTAFERTRALSSPRHSFFSGTSTKINTIQHVGMIGIQIFKTVRTDSDSYVGGYILRELRK